MVKGVQVVLKAVALSIKSGGQIGSLAVGGRIATSGDGVNTVEIEGEVGRLEAGGGIRAEGANSDAVHAAGEVPGLDSIELHAVQGRSLVRP